MKLNSKSINYNVQTVDELLSLDGLEGDTVVVTDENRGGVFVYREDNVGTNNEGTIFNGWTRQYDGAVNVKWFGASENITNNEIYIQAALNSFDNVRIPEGVFQVSTLDSSGLSGMAIGAYSLYVNNNQNLQIDGTLKVKDYAYGAGAFYAVIRSLDVGVSNVDIYGAGSIDGNKNNQIASTQCSNIVIECVSDVKVRDISLINANGNGVMLRGKTTAQATNLSIQNTTVKNVTSIGIQSAQFNGLVISDNYVDGCVNNCIDIYGEDGDTSVNSTNYSITSNICKNGLVGIFNETVAAGVNSGNSIYGCTIGITINRIIGAPENILIIGNEIKNCSYGIRVTGDTSGFVITDNSISNFTTVGIRLGQSGGNCSYGIIEGNYLRPSSNTVNCIDSSANALNFIRGRNNSVNSNGIAESKLWLNSAGSSYQVTIDSFSVIPYQVGYRNVSDKATYLAGTFAGISGSNFKVSDGSVNNIGGGGYVLSIAAPENTSGLLIVTALQGGVGNSNYTIPYVYGSFGLAVGTAITAVKNANPLGVVGVSGSNITIAITYANTNVKYAFIKTITE